MHFDFRTAIRTQSIFPLTNNKKNLLIKDKTVIYTRFLQGDDSRALYSNHPYKDKIFSSLYRIIVVKFIRKLEHHYV